MSIELKIDALIAALEANTAAQLGGEAPKAKGGRKAAAAETPAASAAAQPATTATVVQTAQTAAAVAAPPSDPRANLGYKETAEILTKAAEAKGRDPVIAVLGKLQPGCDSLLKLAPALYAAARAEYQLLLAPTQPAPAAGASSLV